MYLTLPGKHHSWHTNATQYDLTRQFQSVCSEVCKLKKTGRGWEWWHGMRHVFVLWKPDLLILCQFHHLCGAKKFITEERGKTLSQSKSNHGSQNACIRHNSSTEFCKTNQIRCERDWWDVAFYFSPLESWCGRSPGNSSQSHKVIKEHSSSLWHFWGLKRNSEVGWNARESMHAWRKTKAQRWQAPIQFCRAEKCTSFCQSSTFNANLCCYSRSWGFVLFLTLCFISYTLLWFFFPWEDVWQEKEWVRTLIRKSCYYASPCWAAQAYRSQPKPPWEKQP